MINRGNTKPFKTYFDQLQILKKRGLIISDDAKAIEILKRVNYYRFSAYSLTLRKNNIFNPNVTFDNIFELYRFDIDFRNIIMKYCLDIEITFRSYIAYYHAETYSPLSYLDPTLFDNPLYHGKFIVDLDKELNRSDDLFVDHHVKNCNSVFPIWVIVEVSSFGTLSKFYKNMNAQDRNAIAKKYTKYSREYIENWLQCCVYCRNIAAHGGRFYNRKLKSCPVKLSKKHKAINNTEPFAFVIAIKNLLPTESLKNALIKDISDCFAAYPFAMPSHLGFPSNWKNILVNS